LVISGADLIAPGRTFFPDVERIVEEARSRSEDGKFVVLGKYRAWEMPLTAMIYSIFYGFFGEGEAFIKSVRVSQAFLHVLTAIGAASIAFSIFGNRCTAVIVLFSMIIYPSLLAYQAVLLSETLFVFFLVWGFVFLYRWSEERPFMLVFSVLSFTLSLYTRAAITLLAPLLVAARSIYVADGRPGVRAKYFALSCILFAVCFSPWWIRNWHIFGKFVPLTTSPSWNLYLGNNPANQTAGVDWATDVDVERVGEIFSLNDELMIDKAFSEEAKLYIAQNKMIFLKNAWLKFKRFWNYKLNTQEEKLPKYFRYYNLASILSWGIAFPLAIVSAWLNRRKFRLIFPIYLLIAYYTFIHVVVIASLRYRLPIEPFFLILGADCLYRLSQKFRRI
jgi:hypothetical protein